MARRVGSGRRRNSRYKDFPYSPIALPGVSFFARDQGVTEASLAGALREAPIARAGNGLAPAIEVQQRLRHVVDGVFFFAAVGIRTGEVREHRRDLEMD